MHAACRSDCRVWAALCMPVGPQKSCTPQTIRQSIWKPLTAAVYAWPAGQAGMHRSSGNEMGRTWGAEAAQKTDQAVMGPALVTRTALSPGVAPVETTPVQSGIAVVDNNKMGGREGMECPFMFHCLLPVDRAFLASQEMHGET